jgi:glucose-6-phosphate isomerase
MSLTYQNLDRTKAGKKLLKGFKVEKLKTLLTADRVKKASVPTASGWVYNYASKAVDDEALSTLADLAQEQNVIAKYKAILDGQRWRKPHGSPPSHTWSVGKESEP